MKAQNASASFETLFKRLNRSYFVQLTSNIARLRIKKRGDNDKDKKGKEEE